MKLLTSFIFIGITFFELCAEVNVEYDYETDIYYSNVSMFVDIDNDENVTNAANYSEIELYTHLIANTFSPNIFLVEAAVYPMPIAGLYFRGNHEEIYSGNQVGDFNPIQLITAGFEEPYSLSFFLGRMIVFNKDNEDDIHTNRAFVGYLVSVGDMSIKDNRAHKNSWVDFEVKIKGTREYELNSLDWSFRIGSRINNNNNFTDTLYLGARRSRVDFDKEGLSLFYNSAFNVMVSSSLYNFELVEVQTSIEKKWPDSWFFNATFGLEVGYLYYSGAKYRGALKEEGIDNHSLIIRPNFSF
jgi:hypothetical protein